MSDKRNCLIANRVRDAEKSSERQSQRQSLRMQDFASAVEDDEEDRDFDMMSVFGKTPRPRGME